MPRKTITESAARRIGDSPESEFVLNQLQGPTRSSSTDPTDSTAHLQEAIHSKVKRLILDRQIILQRKGQSKAIAIDDAWLETMSE